jgi:hypothetical protein
LTNPKKDDIINKMRKLSLGVVYCATVSVVLILGACMKPVGIDDFLKDSRVQDIIGGKEGVKGGIDYEHPVDLKPVLNDGALSEDDVVTVRINTTPTLPDSITITVSNATVVGYGIIAWYCNGVDLGLSGNSINVIAGSAPFVDGEKMYRLVVTGTVNGIPYSTGIYVWVE